MTKERLKKGIRFLIFTSGFFLLTGACDDNLLGTMSNLEFAIRAIIGIAMIGYVAIQHLINDYEE